MPEKGHGRIFSCVEITKAAKPFWHSCFFSNLTRDMLSPFHEGDRPISARWPL